MSHLFELYIRANFYSTSEAIWRVHILIYPFIGANICVLGLIMAFPAYLRSAMVRFPLYNWRSLKLNVKTILMEEVDLIFGTKWVPIGPKINVQTIDSVVHEILTGWSPGLLIVWSLVGILVPWTVDRFVQGTGKHLFPCCTVEKPVY